MCANDRHNASYPFKAAACLQMRLEELNVFPNIRSTDLPSFTVDLVAPK